MTAFLTLAFVHLLGVASPGPDFAIIVKQSIGQPRRNVLLTAVGIGLGIFVHVGYSLLGIGFLIAQSIVLFSIIKFLGAGYLLFLGWKSLTAKRTHTEFSAATSSAVQSGAKALRIGFLTNVLNPKVTLFFLALFTQVIDPHTSLPVQLFYGTYMAGATIVWFSMLGSVLTMNVVRRSLDAVHLWAERFMGVVLIALGLKVALTSQR